MYTFEGLYQFYRTNGPLNINRFPINLFSKPLILDITQPLEENVQKLNDFQPDILGGYFTGLKILAEEQKKDRLNPELWFFVIPITKVEQFSVKFN